MSSVKKDELDEEIEHYASMSDEQIDAELAGLGMDVQPTIDAVTKLVQAKLAEWKRAGIGKS